MVALKPPKYPPTLTTQSWDKAKGLMARVARGHTGVSDELKKAAKAFMDAPWFDLPDPPEEDERSEEELAKLEKEKARIKVKFDNLQVVFEELSEFLAKSAKTYEKDKLMKQAVEALKTMAENAQDLSGQVAWKVLAEEYEEALAEAEEEAKAATKDEASAIAVLKKLIDNAATRCKNLARENPAPGVNKYKEFKRLKLRGIKIQVDNVAKFRKTTNYDLKDALAEARKSWADSVPLPKPTDNIKARLKKDADLLKKFKDKVDKF